jgi:uncharacterized protein YhhL (DUF1145 family)
MATNVEPFIPHIGAAVALSLAVKYRNKLFLTLMSSPRDDSPFFLDNLIMFGDSLHSADYTYHNDKLSCWKPIYICHVIFAYITVLSGLVAFVTRIWPRFKWLHSYAGKFYIMFMVWTAATAIVIHNFGSPIAVLLNFALVILGLSFGWIVIWIHQSRRQQQPTKKNGLWRVLSWKGLHGILMFVSWMNISGRIFATPNLANFECRTYAIFKPYLSDNNSDDRVKLVPEHNPKEYNATPWANNELGWTLMLSLGVGTVSLLFGIGYSFAEDWIEKRNSRRRIMLE